MSKRERTIGILTVSVLGLLGVYQFVIDPLLVRKGELDEQVAARRTEIDQTNDLYDRSKRAGVVWSQMVTGGLRKDASEAESVVLHSVRDWAQEAGMNLTGLTPARPEKDKDFFKITVRATATGKMADISRFLFKIQNSTIPIRVTELQINNHGKEGTDDLGVQLAISTVYLSPQLDKPRTASALSVAEVTR
jgi:hypothetical protein